MNRNLIESIKKLLNFETIAETIIIIAATWMAVAGLQRLSRLLGDRFPRQRVKISSAFPVVRLAVWVGVAYFIISLVIEPGLNTLVAIAASAGVAIGLGAQELVKNILSGILILFDRPFRVGDLIKVDSYYGEVIHIGLGTSRIHTFDDSIVAIPNGIFLSKAVTNSNSGELTEQVVVEFRLPGHVDVEDMKGLMQEAALCSPYVCRRKPVNVLVEDRYEYGFLTMFRVKAYVMDIRFEPFMASDITERIKEAIAASAVLPQ